MRSRIILLIAVAIAGVGGGFHQWTSPAHASGVCGTENAQSPIYGSGVITAPHVKAGNCPTWFQIEIKVQAESGGTWYFWECQFSGEDCNWQSNIVNAGDVITKDTTNFNPIGSEGGLKAQQLCAYRERVFVRFLGPNGVMDTYASSADPASC
jgi:hypothetical protein